jgi:putative endonuclease
MWLAAHPSAAVLDLRFDVVVSVPLRLPRHLVGAFDAGGSA